MGELLAGATTFGVLGVIGVLFYLGSYVALQAGVVKGEGYLYASLNSFAAGLVLFSLIDDFNLSSVLINSSYITISVFGMVRFYLFNQRIKFTPDEQAFLNVAAPTLAKVQARRLLKMGFWQSPGSGTALTVGGAEVTHLHFLLNGDADVSVAGNRVARLGPWSLIGEMACLTGMPASASVILTTPANVLSFEVRALKNFLTRNLTVQNELERYFANQINDKLIRTNATLSEISTAAETHV